MEHTSSATTQVQRTSPAAPGAGERLQPNSAETVRSVDRAARLIEALFLAPEGKHLAELSNELGLHKTTVLRLLRTLVAVGLVQREPATDHYRFEPLKWVSMACHIRRTMDRSHLVQRALDDLTEALGETTLLVVPDFERRRTILATCAQPRNAVRVDLSGARVAPMHATAVGKTFLAHLSDRDLERWMQAPLQAVTPHTVTDPAQLAAEVRQVREREYAVACQESLLGVSEVGVAICDDTGKPVGALGLAVVAERVPEEKIADCIPLLRRAANQVSGLLYPGGRGVIGPSSPEREQAETLPGRQGVAQGETELQKVYRVV